MGGAGAMRAAAKVAGISVVNSGIRGFPALAPAEHPVAATAAARKANHAVSAIAASSDDLKTVGSLQRPCWEVDDWEFAGGEEELVVGVEEPLPRLVFGGAPSLQEANDATSELKDTLEKVYLSSPTFPEPEVSHIAGQESGLHLLSNSEALETKACVSSEFVAAPPVSRNAIQAFRFLNESPAAQTVVASIACDPNVWNAVLQNEALVEFLQSQKTSSSFSNVNVEEAVDLADFPDQQTVKSLDECSESGKSRSENSLDGFWQTIKVRVVDMLSSLSDYFQNISGVPTEKGSLNGATSLDKALGASVMGLAIMVIMVVVLKRA